MKKLAVIICLLALPVVVMATSSNGNGVQAQTGATSTATQNETSVSTQTQTQTQNAGESTQLQVKTEAEVQTEVNEAKPEFTPAAEAAQTRTNEVAKAVESLIRVANRVSNPEVGDQIREIARNQSADNDKAEQALQNAEKRTTFAKVFIGANFAQVKEAEQVREQNRVRIQELQKLMNQETDSAIKAEIQNQINILEIQNLNLANQIKDDLGGFTFFGWFIRWFYGV